MSVYEVVEKKGERKVLDIFSKKEVSPFEEEIVLASLSIKEKEEGNEH